MLRYVLRVHKHHDEDWKDYLKRAANKVDTVCEDFGVEDWVMMQRRRKWRFAGKLARQNDGRFARQVLEYTPHLGYGRGAGRPRLRWADEIENFAGGSWLKIAEDEELWAAAEGLFTLA